MLLLDDDDELPDVPDEAETQLAAQLGTNTGGQEVRRSGDKEQFFLRIYSPDLLIS